jgi:hypothetical protein
MTTPSDTGAVDTTPTTGGSLPYGGSGWGGAEFEEAPDVAQGAQHRPGMAPHTVVLEGPAMMPANKVDAKSSKKGSKK